MSHENVGRLWNAAVTGGMVRPKFKIIVKTADYTLTDQDYGSIFTTRGGSGVTFTFPAASDLNKGEWALFMNVANQNMFVAGPDEGLVVFNDLTADSAGFATTNEKIAGTLLALSDGTSWIVLPLATETQTVTISTAPSSSPSSSTSSSPSSSTSSSPSSSPSASPSSSPSATPSSSPSASPSSSPSATPSSSPSASPSSSPSASPSSSPSAT